MDNPSFNIQDDGDFNQGVPTLKEIILMHIKKISAICCNEFTKGYWEEKPIKIGGGVAIMRKYNPDQRAVFCNAVDFLLWVVFPMSDEPFQIKYGEELKENTIKTKKVYSPKKEEEIITEKEDWAKKLNQRKEIFKDINLMFARTNFFDSQSGVTE